MIYSTVSTKGIFTTKFSSAPFTIHVYEVLYMHHFNTLLQGTIKT